MAVTAHHVVVLFLKLKIMFEVLGAEITEKLGHLRVPRHVADVVRPRWVVQHGAGFTHWNSKTSQTCLARHALHIHHLYIPNHILQPLPRPFADHLPWAGINRRVRRTADPAPPCPL